MKCSPRTVIYATPLKSMLQKQEQSTQAQHKMFRSYWFDKFAGNFWFIFDFMQLSCNRITCVFTYSQYIQYTKSKWYCINGNAVIERIISPLSAQCSVIIYKLCNYSQQVQKWRSTIISVPVYPSVCSLHTRTPVIILIYYRDICNDIHTNLSQNLGFLVQ